MHMLEITKCCACAMAYDTWYILALTPGSLLHLIAPMHHTQAPSAASHDGTGARRGTLCFQACHPLQALWARQHPALPQLCDLRRGALHVRHIRFQRTWVLQREVCGAVPLMPLRALGGPRLPAPSCTTRAERFSVVIALQKGDLLRVARESRLGMPGAPEMAMPNGPR